MGRDLLSTRRRWRLERKRELRDRGIQPARLERILAVRITEIEMPAWAHERRIRGLSFDDTFVWLRRRDARYLMRLDYEAGGRPRWTETEFRRCPVCGRPLIGDDARMRRDLDESCVTGRQRPCGAECLEAARDKRWRTD